MSSTMVAHAYGKTATFMPKPIKADNGSGMHTHMSIWSKAASRSSPAPAMRAFQRNLALYFIGGVIKHAQAR